MSNLPDNIKEYLNKRGISDDIISRASIKWLNNKVVLPIYDMVGNFVFNKYRCSPFAVDNSLPKYTYDFGAKATLYNSNNVNFSSTVIITEGELDALCLESCGLQAVSTTGGSGTFKEEWATLFNNTPEIIICYDRDKAGITGMLRVQRILPQAKLLFLPEFKGKDITDFITTYGPAKFKEILSTARSWYIPKPTTTIAVSKQVTNYNRIANEALEEKRMTNNDIYLQAIIDEALEYREQVRIKKKKVLYVPQGNGDLERAKTVPISDYLNFNNRGYTTCIWHDEKTPSLRYDRKTNKVYCYGQCAIGRDVIDVVQKLKGCSLKEAINILLGK